MALNLKAKETDRLAREVAALTGESLTDAVRVALAERLERVRLRKGESAKLADQLMERSDAVARPYPTTTRTALTRLSGMTKLACGDGL